MRQSFEMAVFMPFATVIGAAVSVTVRHHMRHQLNDDSASQPVA
jgi:hypothetical protein